MLPNFLKHKNFTVADTTAPLSHFYKNGYYTVGNKIFLHRIYALQEASKTNHKLQFHYCDEIFEQVDWSKPSGIEITELYRMRAQQLRQKYDYLLCCWSGGVDSTAMIESFLMNNIKLDEIVIAWPLKYLDGRYKVTRNTDATNLMSEWQLAIKPKLDWIQKEYPEVKITVADYSDELGDDEYAEDTVIHTAKHGYIPVKKYRAMDKVLRERQEKYHNVAQVTGVSPIQCCIFDNYLVSQFIDDHCNNGPKSDYHPDGWIRNVEFFYWSPDFPEIPVEQAHLFLNYLNQHPYQQRLFDKLTIQPDRTFKYTNVGNTEEKRELGRHLFYPNWDRSTFQANKPASHVGFTEWYAWYYGNQHAERSMQSFSSAIKEHNLLINHDYFVFVGNQIGNYKPQFSRHHAIGKLALNVVLTK